MRALIVLVGSVVILAVIQAASLFVDARKTHEAHSKSIKFTARTESVAVTEGVNEPQPLGDKEVPQKLDSDDIAVPAIQSDVSNERQGKYKNTNKESKVDRPREHRPRKGNRRTGSNYSEKDVVKKKAHRFCLQHPEMCHRNKKESHHKHGRRQNVKDRPKNEKQMQKSDNTTDVTESRFSGKSVIRKNTPKTRRLNRKAKASNETTGVDPDKTSRKSKFSKHQKHENHEKHHKKGHKKMDGDDDKHKVAFHMKGKKYSKSHDHKNTMTKKQMVAKRRIAMANKRKNYRKQMEKSRKCTEGKQCNKREAKHHNDISCQGIIKRGENRRCLTTCQCKTGLSCFVAEAQYPTKKKMHGKHKPVGKCIPMQNGYLRAGYFITEAPPTRGIVNTTVGSIMDTDEP